MRLIIVRHGETPWTISNRYTSSTDLALTEHGRHQSAAVRPILQNLIASRPTAVYSSPLIRAIETMDLALPGLQREIEPLLSEFDYGSYEGETFETIQAEHPGWDIWRDGCPEGETTNEVGNRADQFLNKYVNHEKRPVIVFTHGHFSRILTARALGLEGMSGSLFASSVASVSMVTEHHGIRCIGLWNVSPEFFDAK